MKSLTRLAAALALAAAFSAPALAQTAMKISISVAQNSHQGVAIDTFAREVEKRTGGRYKVQPFYSGSLGGEQRSVMCGGNLDGIEGHGDVQRGQEKCVLCGRVVHCDNPQYPMAIQ